MKNIEIKKVTPDNIEQLQAISKKTFIDTFSATNTEENMTKYLNQNLSLEKLSDELNDPNSEFYFAISNDNIIGYLKVNSAQSQTELKDNNAIEIERIYVLHEFHGKEVGKLLYNKAIQIAKSANAKYIWLGVWEKNPRAISFYKKNGFIEFDKHIFNLGDDKQTDIIMKLEIETSM